MPIPASQIVEINPRIISAGSKALEFNALFLTQNSDMPSDEVLAFADASSVCDYFGDMSTEAQLATIYFNGYTNAYKSPNSLYFAKRNLHSSPAWLLGDSIDVNTVTLKSIRDLGKTSLLAEIVGNEILLEDIDLSNIQSYSEVAKIIEQAFHEKALEYLEEETAPNPEIEPTPDPDPVPDPVPDPDPEIDTEQDEEVSLVKNLVSSSNSLLYQALENIKIEYLSYKKAFKCTLSLEGENSIISSFKGELANILLLDASFAKISRGQNAISGFEDMENILSKCQNWVNFSTTWLADKEEVLELAKWTNSKNLGYLFLFADDDKRLLELGNTETISYALQERNYSCVAGQYKSLEYCAFIMAIGASIDYSRQEGAITTAFKSQSGLGAVVDKAEDAKQLIENKMNFVGDYATRNSNFIFNYPGQMFGTYAWIDVYWNAIWLNNTLQLALLQGLMQSPRTPYSAKGYAQVRAWIQDPINQALKNNVIEAGISLSESQKSQINREAGKIISTELENNGYYLQIIDPSASDRANRLSPNVQLWYSYGGAINSLTLSSTCLV